MSTQRYIPAYTWAHCWNATFSNSAWERIKEKSGSSLCTKFSHPLTLHPPSPFYLYILLPSNTKATSVWLSHFSPSPLLVIPLSQWDKSACDFPWLCVCLSPSIPFISLFCSPWQFICLTLSQCCHWIPCSGVASRCICCLIVSNTKQQAFLSFINLLCSCSNCVLIRSSM